ncbi:V1 [Sputnik virophage]|uniref:Uncharacterized protein V1 n=3 Tax=Mimivirus-dependent virus Sputnik TaxID=1932927 RepID=V1_SPTNK|nr:V1 [Sputnik virophage]B4YNE1.1 RecName: Full=Uncharacterized protein V1 [Sputnik virophage]AFH75255.1 hypothetical protein Sputnik2_R1 [Sputnik virophage 2]AFH75275.1 hypothetical protein Sputnik3_R1 [Sputnik virophage 3]UMZ08513.1 zinc ribbon-containing protein [Mimivirus-dependent virus Sputnik]ACF16985.1 V1 [Sputnik virophage]AUG84988.1 hypothetical protein [Sputnik virophage 2]
MSKVQLYGTPMRGGCCGGCECPNCGFKLGGVVAGVLAGGKVSKRRKSVAKKGGIGTKGGAKKSPWVAFLQRYSKEHGVKYSEAMQSPKAKKEYSALKKSGKIHKVGGSKSSGHRKTKKPKKSMKGGSKTKKLSEKQLMKELLAM